MVNRRDSEVVLEDVEIRFPNFAGKEGQYNRAGDRNFSIVLDPLKHDIERMQSDGWNVKHRVSRDAEEGDDGWYYMHVKVSYNEKAQPPKIILVTRENGKIKNRTPLGEDEIDILDWAEVINADLIIAPYDWTVRGDHGRSAYLRSLYVEIYLDPLALKYGAMDGIGGE